MFKNMLKKNVLNCDKNVHHITRSGDTVPVTNKDVNFMLHCQSVL